MRTALLAAAAASAIGYGGVAHAQNTTSTYSLEHGGGTTICGVRNVGGREHRTITRITRGSTTTNEAPTRAQWVSSYCAERVERETTIYPHSVMQPYLQCRLAAFGQTRTYESVMANREAGLDDSGCRNPIPRPSWERR